MRPYVLVRSAPFFALSVALFAHAADAADAAASSGTTVRGEGTSLRFTWEAPSGCPTATAVRDAALLRANSEAPGRAQRPPPSEATAEPLDADARVEHGDRWRVTIRTRRGGVPAAPRQLEATSCVALADATAVILALALLPPGRDTETGDAIEAPPPVPAPPAASSTSTPALASTSAGGEERSRTIRPYGHTLSAGLAVATDAVTLPAPAVGGTVSIAFTPGRARVEAFGSAFSGQSKTTDRSGAGADFTLLVVGSRGCWAIVRGLVEIAPCLGLDLQVLSARGFGAIENYDAGARWLAASGGALVRVPVTSWLALRGQVDAAVPFARPRFVVEGDGAVHRPASVGARAGIGAELLFL